MVQHSFMIFASIAESKFYDPIRVRATSKDTLLGVINGVQVEVSGVGGDAIYQLDIPSSNMDSTAASRKKQVGRRKRGVGSRKRERRLTRESSKCWYVPNHPSIPEQP